MASPMTNVVKSPEAGATPLYIQWAVGAVGAVGAIQGPGGSRMKEFRRITAANPSPVVHTGVGVYDIFLRETWMALLKAYGFTIGAIAAASGVYGKPTTNSVTSTSAPKVTMTFVRIDTGVSAEITNGDIACVELVLKCLRPV